MRNLCCWALLLTTAMVGRADVVSGPKVGDRAQDFTAYGVAGIIDGKEGNYLKERKGEPTIYVFIRHDTFNRPTARFLKGLDTALKDAPGKVAVVAIWLSDKPDTAKEYLPKAQMSLGFVNTSLGVFTGEKSGPKNWGINTDAYATVVIVKYGTVTAVQAFQVVNETDVKAVLTDLNKPEAKKAEPKKK
ncbi:hypothetical protein [Zavarzinella formosa]|uniref:hypothetical protein n=1 Tax=Zavarzinella formosa TaxID=360055 RepID=UPI000316B7FB|nr:hypothetical protein [Zavarzinella formosa]